MSANAFDHHGPCINLRTVTLCESIDPLGIGEYVNWETEREIFDAVGFEAQSFVMSGKEVLRDGLELHDYGKFGNCIGEAIEDAKELRAKIGDQVDTIVVARLVSSPSFFSKDEAFYHHSVKIFRTLPRWGWRWVSGKSEDITNLDKTVTIFTVWKNGKFTDQWPIVQRIINEWPARDIAADRRRKPSQ